MMESFILDSQSSGSVPAPRCIALSVVSHIPFFPIAMVLLCVATKREGKSHAATAKSFWLKMDSLHPPSGLSVLLESLYSLPISEISTCGDFQSLLHSGIDKQWILEAIPDTPRPSARPLALLRLLLIEMPGSWPTFPLIKCFTRLYHLMPEGAKSHRDEDLAQLIYDTSELVKNSYTSFASFILCDSRPALRASTPGDYITHKGLRRFVDNFQLPTGNSTRKPIVAITLPNGPLLAATCIAVTTYYTSAPINPTAGAEQFRADVQQAGAQFILTTRDDCDRLGLRHSWVASAGIRVFVMKRKNNDEIEMHDLSDTVISQPNQNPSYNGPDDFGLILFTSGTSGTKKVVPLTMHSIVAGISFVVDSWGLTASDVCLNMMPLYHVGGLVRNIFAPVFSGGSTVCCSAFDPSLFWDVVQEIPVTWYYASPSMHSVILAVAPDRQTALQQSCIRLACNAAGGLLPSLACRLRDTFKCTVLPSYGMTECMPISTPPLNYQLDREGTSGISTGPELSILDWSDSLVSCGDVGRICVRGEPVFPGYLKPDRTLDKSPFDSNGWFDTGDLGYMDEGGYLYITGRSKEVINRGGELISPFEVENAIMRSSMSPDSPLYGRILQALAFSVPHDVLQEVVAVALVTPTNAPRVALKTLQAALRSSLQQVKWPVLITYMNDLPKKNNKVLRIKLGQRCGIPELMDGTPYLNRHWEAICPPPDTDLSVPINSSQCTIDYDALSAGLEAVVSVDFRHYCRQNNLRGTLQAFIGPAEGKSGVLNRQPDGLKAQLSKTLHEYLVPEDIHLLSDPLPLDHSGAVDIDALDRLLAELGNASVQELEAPTEGKVRKVFSDVLCRPPGDIALNIDFFTLGGDSLKAGRLVSALRSTFTIQIPINLVFNQGTVSAIAAFVNKTVELPPVDTAHDNKAGCSTTYSSTNPIVMLLQLIPLAVVYPLRRAVQWTAFIVVMSYVQKWPTNESTIGRLINVVLSVIFSKFIIRCVCPLFGIAAKWLIIGRYREGLYPMWGPYHTRWWMVQKIVTICGKGFFNINDSTKNMYYRLMGAKIGSNVEITGTTLGEWDLLDIRDGATLTSCTCRPFAVEGNTSMYLGRIVIGENASIGVASIIAPGAIIPPNACIGPNSSSWELEDAAEESRDISPSQIPEPHMLLFCFLTIPLVLLSWALSLLPWLGGLVGMVMDMPKPDASPMRDILDWFSEPKRVGFHSLALVLRSLHSPFVFFAFALFVKLLLDAILGKMTFATARDQGAITTWRADLMRTLLPVSRLHDMTAMFGQHYEATSVAIRLLGGRIGKRIYWSGTGPSVGDYHLLDIGNDVVFGSRSHFITSDGIGSQKITVQDHAMIADRVCLLPGVTIGKHTTMGSGALTRRGKSYIPGGTFVGSKGRDCVYLSGGQSAAQDEKNLSRLRMRHMSSDDTLTGTKIHSKKSSVQTQIHHSSSDDTLAEPRASKTKRNAARFDRHQKEAFTTSESDIDDNGPETTETDNMSPFGRAFYLKLAPYHVIGQFTIFCYSSFIAVFTSFYWNAPIVCGVQVVDHLMNRFVSRDAGITFNVAILFLMAWAGIAILLTTLAVVALLVVIASKWILLGRRMPGNYDWDKSSYCQRWQIFLSIERLRRHCYHNQGVIGLLTGTSWVVFYFRALGAEIGKDCAIFANGSPSLIFTEPDLIKLGDRVAIDDASVVAHINTRGKFDLNRLSIGDRCVMRSGSRLLSGATMQNDSCLLEHTLIMGGDVVKENWTMQGWPAERYIGKRTAIV